QLIAMIVSLAITPVLTTSVFGSEESTGGFTTTAVLYALLAVTVITFMALGVRENPRHSTRQRPRFLRGMGQILSNPSFWAVGLTAAGGLGLWSQMITRIGALRTWRIAFVVLTASFVAMFFATGLLSAVAAGIVMGMGWSGMMATNDLVVARVLDADAARTGE